MEKSQYSLCEEVLKRLHSAGVLDGMVIVGSWCVLFYEKYFQNQTYTPTIRTRDLDLAIPRPPRFKGATDIGPLLEELGFLIDFKGSEGYIRFLHPELILEFLTPERGRSTSGPYDIPGLGINAQPLRYLDFLLEETITVDFRGIPLCLPHPVRFALHKLIIAERRKNDKADRDRQQACMILHAVVESGAQQTITTIYVTLPTKWRKAIRTGLEDVAETDLLALL